MRISEIGGLCVAEIDAQGELFSAEQDALDLIGQLYGQGVDLVVLPLARLSPEFFRLSNGLAGAFLQKFVNYDVRLAIVGDIAPAASTSAALADFVYESNKVGAVLFVADRDELVQRL